MFGDAVPSGKLTIKFPRTVGQVPIYYVFLSTGRPASESDFFFFKQKTAYEMELRLEFRRVLFRSAVLFDAVDLVDEAHRGRAARLDGRRDRSEERGVGKECRSRWSPYHWKKKK